MRLKVNQGKVDWTPELVARLRALWKQGIPTSQMARLLGPAVTKNSVIGKVHRLRLPLRNNPWGGRRGTHARGVKRPTQHHRKKKPRQIAAKAPLDASLPLPVPDTPKPPPPPPAPLPAPPRPIPQRRMPPGGWTLLDLGHGQCHWPLNSPPRGSVYIFCGDPTFNGTSYCEEHHRIGFTGTRRQATTAGWQPRQTGF
jgi:hypothetical protein